MKGREHLHVVPSSLPLIFKCRDCAIIHASHSISSTAPTPPYFTPPRPRGPDPTRASSQAVFLLTNKVPTPPLLSGTWWWETAVGLKRHFILDSETQVWHEQLLETAPWLW